MNTDLNRELFFRKVRNGASLCSESDTNSGTSVQTVYMIDQGIESLSCWYRVMFAKA